MLGGSLLGGELGRGRVKPLGHAGDLRVDLGDAVVELQDADLCRGLLSLEVRLLRLERGKGRLGLGELLLASGLLRLERGFLLRVALRRRVERIELGLELRDRGVKRVDDRLGLGDAGLDLRDSLIELLEPLICLVALLHKARACAHGILIGRPAVVDLLLRLVERRACLGALLYQRRDPGFVLRLSVGELRLTRRDGRPRGLELPCDGVELGLGVVEGCLRVVELRLRVGLLLLELGALLVELFLRLGSKVVDATSRELVRHTVDAVDHLIDLGLIGVDPPLQLASALDGYKGLGIGIILRKRAVWDIDIAREPAASERGRARIR